MFSTLRGTTSFWRVIEATVATPALAFVERITLPVLPSNSMSVCRMEGDERELIYEFTLYVIIKLFGMGGQSLKPQTGF